jgi:Thioredoxin-like
MIERVMRALLRLLVLPATLSLSLPASLPACGLEWEVSFAETLQAAKDTHRLALVFVTGSDWSPRSIRLDGDVWMDPTFFDYVTTNFVLFDADFPQRTKLPAQLLAENTAFAHRYRVKHFPTMLLLRADGTEVERMEYTSETALQVRRTLQGAMEAAVKGAVGDAALKSAAR